MPFFITYTKLQYVKMLIYRHYVACGMHVSFMVSIYSILQLAVIMGMEGLSLVWEAQR